VLRVRLCYRRRKEQPDLSISSSVIPVAPTVYIPTAKFKFLGFIEDDGYVGGPGGGGRGLSFFFGFHQKQRTIDYNHIFRQKARRNWHKNCICYTSYTVFDHFSL
jgi:hypothetical protein